MRVQVSMQSHDLIGFELSMLRWQGRVHGVGYGAGGVSPATMGDVIGGVYCACCWARMVDVIM